MSGGESLLVIALVLAGLDAAAWVFGADSRDAGDRDPFPHEPAGNHGFLRRRRGGHG